MGRVLKIYWLHLALAGGALILWDTPVVKPFRIFVVWVHEMGHATAALATGGQVVELRVRWDESGQVASRGGIFPIVSSAGYVGAACLGALLIYAGRWRELQRLLLGVIGATQIVLAILFTPILGGDFWFGVGCGIVLIILAVRSGYTAYLVATWIGVMLCLYSLEDFRTDLWVHTEQTDAGILARYLGISLLAYPIALVWAGVSIWVMFIALRGLARHQKIEPEAPVATFHTESGPGI